MVKFWVEDIAAIGAVTGAGVTASGVIVAEKFRNTGGVELAETLYGSAAEMLELVVTISSVWLNVIGADAMMVESMPVETNEL